MIAGSTRIALTLLLVLTSGCTHSTELSRPVPATPPHDVHRLGQDNPSATNTLGASTTTRYSIGRSPSATEIASWDIDIMPDGTGLPDGSGNAAEGRALYAAQCQRCHGADGRGGPFDQLAGRLPGDAFPFALDPRVKHTIGNYWPFATTIFDYTRRAMPQDRPGSLTDDEVYSLTAYLLYLNELWDEGAILDRETLPQIVMPTRDRFVPDDRRGGPEIR